MKAYEQRHTKPVERDVTIVTTTTRVLPLTDDVVARLTRGDDERHCPGWDWLMERALEISAAQMVPGILAEDEAYMDYVRSTLDRHVGHGLITQLQAYDTEEAT